MRVKIINILFAIFIVIISITFLYYSFNSEIGFGDETYYILASKSIIDNNWIVPKFMRFVYSTGSGNGELLGKPPLSYYVPAIFYSLGLFKIYAAVFGILTVALTYFIGKKMYSGWVGLLASIILAGTPLFIHFSIISYTETVTSFFILLSVYLIYNTLNEPKNKNIILAGVLLGVAFLTKKISYFIIPLFLVYLVLQLKNKTYKKESLKKFVLILFIGFLVAFPWLLRNWFLLGNPVYPHLVSVFGYDNIDPVGYEAYFSEAKKFLWENLNIQTFYNYLTINLIIGLMGTVYIMISEWKNKDLLMLISAIFFILPFFLSPAVDIRYIYSFLPFWAIISSNFLVKLVSTYSAHKTYLVLFIILILFLCVYFIHTTYSESKRIAYSVRSKPDFLMEAFDWLKNNTLNDDVIYDLWIFDCAHFTKRVCVYYGPYSGELWKWWEKPKNEAVELLKKYNITYIVVEDFLFSAPTRGIWSVTPREVPNRIIEWKIGKKVYDNGYVSIYKLEY